jgi:hypothetical protein
MNTLQQKVQKLCLMCQGKESIPIGEYESTSPSPY